MKRTNKLGFSLPEISLAVLIFALVAIPLYYAVTYGSLEEIQLDKVAIANKILESYRDEIKNLDFKTVSEGYVGSIDGAQLPPNAFKSLLEAQQKYKDFKFFSKGEKQTVNDIESISFKAEVKWTRGSGGESSQKISFIKVK